MAYKTLFIRESNHIKLYLDNIVVETKEGEIRFLISDLKFLIIDNYKTVLSTQLINKLTENNVSIVLCDLSHLPFSTILPLSGHYASASMVKEQIEWSNIMKTKLHKSIVQSKIESQICILKANYRSLKVVDRLISFRSEVEDGDVTNREGLSAKMYFRELFGIEFIRFEDDGINAGLNYGYAIFRSLISAILVSKGLLLSLGIFHKGPTNQYNLADDVIEVFRPIVDDYVFNHLSEEDILSLDHRQNLIRLTDSKILFDGQKHTIYNAIEMYIESIIRCFKEEDISLFKAPSLIKIEYDL